MGSTAKKDPWTGVEERDQFFMLACVMYGLLDTAEIDFVDLDVNEAGMRLSSMVTDQGSQVGLERLAGQALRPRFGA